MQAEKITLKYLQQRGGIDLVGGILEIPWRPHSNSPTRIFRCKIAQFRWYPDSNIQTIEVEWIVVWNESLAMWKDFMNEPYRFDFNWKIQERVVGVYEIEDGEIAVFIENEAYLSFFPINCEPPTDPIDRQKYSAIHNKITHEKVDRVEIPDWT